MPASETVDVASRLDAATARRLDELARRHRWSRSSAIAFAVEQLVRSEPSGPVIAWDDCEVRA